MRKPHRTIEIDFEGNDLQVDYAFKKGLGFMGRDQPPDENEVDILEIRPLEGAQMPSDDIGTRWDIERLIESKIED